MFLSVLCALITKSLTQMLFGIEDTVTMYQHQYCKLKPWNEESKKIKTCKPQKEVLKHCDAKPRIE